MIATLGDRLRHARHPIVGRDELADSLARLTERDGPVVVFVYGVAGIGKSSVLAESAARARERGAIPIELDCHAIEPTDAGLLDALGQAVGGAIGSVDGVPAVLSELGRPPLLLLDTYERLGLLDTWLRQVFLPLLPAAARVVIASREPPTPPWLYEREWHELFHCIELGPLDDRASLELLTMLDVPADAAPRLNAVARGHPLALTLAAGTLREDRRLTIEDAASQAVVAVLADAYLEEIPDRGTRESLEAAATTRRTTSSLLAAQLPGHDALAAYGRLQSLPFVETRADGLRLHEAVQQAIATRLSTSNPARYRDLRRAAWRQLQSEVRGAGETELWRYTADILYLLENPHLREGFFPSGAQSLAMEPALPGDHPAIREIVRLHEGPQSAAMLDAWLELQPGAFSVARDRTGRVTAFRCSAISDELDRALPDADPVLRAWQEDLASSDGPDVPAFFLRRWLSLDGEQPGEAQALCWIDCKRSYMRLRPNLGSVYVTMRDLATYEAALAELGFRRMVPEGVPLDGQRYYPMVMRFGAGSVDGWLARLAARELGIDATSELLDESAHQLLLSGQRVPLTPLEFAVMRYLVERRGTAVSHAELVEQVWGYRYTGESNVDAVVIRGLRAKLGEQAGLLETVRGVGYLLR